MVQYDSDLALRLCVPGSLGKSRFCGLLSFYSMQGPGCVWANSCKVHLHCNVKVHFSMEARHSGLWDSSEVRCKAATVKSADTSAPGYSRASSRPSVAVPPSFTRNAVPEPSPLTLLAVDLAGWKMRRGWTRAACPAWECNVKRGTDQVNLRRKEAEFERAEEYCRRRPTGPALARSGCPGTPPSSGPR